MTDANYANLSTLKGELKRAAIDAYMKSEGWFVPRDDFYGYEDGNVEGGGDGVTKPGKNGEGGGDWSSNKIREFFFNDGEDQKYRTAFDNIRSRIDGYLKPWEDLPDPETFNDYVEDLRRANVKLAVSFSASGGVASGAGKIGTQLILIQVNSTAMSGGMIEAFKSKFLLALGNAIAGHHGLTVILGQAMTAEQRLLKEARQDVAQAVASATKALDAYAHDSSAELAFAFKVAGAVVAGVSAFATGGATAALAGAAAGLSLLEKVAEHSEKKAKEPKQKDYEGLMDGFKTALDDLNAAITTEEGIIRDNLKDNLDNLQADDTSYNLTNPMQSISDDSELHTVEEGRAIVHNRSLVYEITGTAMPTIADELVAAKDKVWAGWSATPYYRDPSIGLGETGPYPPWADLAAPLWRLIGDLEWEVRNGAKTLELAIEDMGRTDTDAKDALEKHAASIDDYRNYEIPK
ncbi:MAG: hypothetical protein M3237_15975 [Actinomycetota bacterium]|nr:hypothetical protein [Actinomycetota bacterium]